MRIPPPILMLLFGGAMWLGRTVLPVFIINVPFKNWIGLFIVVAAVILAVVAVVKFVLAKTTVTPIKPEKASSLVTTGIYSVTRNPMYVAMLSVLIGWAIYLGQPLNLILVAGYFLMIDRLQIPAEEVALTKIFGTDYTEYCARVRRWL